MLAPVDTIQSMKPASSSGMIVDMPSPAGVIAPVRLIPTVTSSASMRSLKRRQPSARRPALYARNALSTRSATVSRPVTGLGSIRAPRSRSLRVVMAPSSPLVALGLQRVCPAALLAGLPDDRDGLPGTVGDREQRQIGRGDLAFYGDPVAQPILEPAPVLYSGQDEGKVLDLARLDQRECLEELVHGAVTTGKDHERRRILDEHRLAHEKVAEVDRALHVGIQPLLERQLDVTPDREAISLLRAPIRGLHDARPAAGDDREPFLREHPGGFHRLLVVGVVGLGASRAENRDGVVDVRQGVEALDELSHDAEDAPGVRLDERPRLARSLREELFVLSDRGVWQAARALRHSRPGRYRRKERGERGPGARRR